MRDYGRYCIKVIPYNESSEYRIANGVQGRGYARAQGDEKEVILLKKNLGIMITDTVHSVFRHNISFCNSIFIHTQQLENVR